MNFLRSCIVFAACAQAVASGALIELRGATGGVQRTWGDTAVAPIDLAGEVPFSFTGSGNFAGTARWNSQLDSEGRRVVSLSLANFSLTSSVGPTTSLFIVLTLTQDFQIEPGYRGAGEQNFATHQLLATINPVTSGQSGSISMTSTHGVQQGATLEATRSYPNQSGISLSNTLAGPIETTDVFRVKSTFILTLQPRGVPITTSILAANAWTTIVPAPGSVIMSGGAALALVMRRRRKGDERSSEWC